VDFSEAMLARAARRHPRLHFVNADVHALGVLKGPFDVIILSDLINDLWDVQAALTGLEPLMTPGTRLVFNLFSRLWQLPLELAQRLRLAKPVLPQNWLTVEDLLNLLRLTDLEPIRSWQECLLPLPVPLLASLCNRFLVRLWPFRHLAFSNLIVARGARANPSSEASLVSVIVPARNEEGNIEQIFQRTPEMGGRSSSSSKATRKTGLLQPSSRKFGGIPSGGPASIANRVSAKAMPCGTALPPPAAKS
jgi:hypothetical protein